jgi:hypothetical protein
MIQRANGFGFALKALAEFLLGEFHRDDAVEACVAGFPNFAIPPRPMAAMSRYGPKLSSGWSGIC